jgi:hypothetical protein
VGFPQRRTPPVSPAAETGVDQTQDVQGTRGLRQRAASWQRAVLAASLVFATTVESAPDVQPVQPETWTQAVQGTTALSRATRQSRLRGVEASALYYQSTNDPTTVPEPDTWTSPVDGVRALRQAQRLTAQRAAQAGALLYWQSNDLTSGPLPTQPDTWVQPVQGVAAGRTSAQAFRARAVQTSLYWATAQDPPPVVPPDQWTQPVVGTSALRTANQQLRARAVQLSPLLWQTPEDVSGPLATQPDLWSQPTPGTGALSRAANLFARRVGLAQSLYQGTTDAPAVVEPDTWTQPVQGTSALRAGIRGFARRAGVAFTLAQNTNDVPPVVQPETWTQPVVGVQSLGRQQRTWSQRVAGISARLYWQSTDLSTGPLATQPDTWVQPIAGTANLRSTIRQFVGRVLKTGALLWQGPPEDITTPSVFGGADLAIADVAVTDISASDALVLAVTVSPSDRAVTDLTVSDVAIQLVGYVQRVITDGAVAYWRLGETSGTTAVDIIGGKNGTISGGVTLNQPGALPDGNPAMLFNGTTGKITVPANVLDCGSATQSFSIEFWSNGPYTEGNSSLLIKGFAPYNAGGIGWELRHQGTGYWTFGRTNNGPVSRLDNWSVPLNTWSHVVVTYNAATHVATAYVNGLAVKTLTLSGADIAAYADIYPLVMAEGTNGSTFVTLDEVAIYPTALTPFQVATHYAAASPLVDLIVSDAVVTRLDVADILLVTP